MQSIARQFSDAFHWFAETVSKLSIRGDRGPIDSVERLFAFVATRSALITQKKLYGYLKERIGIRYPEMFEDDAFARSIDIAKMEVFAAALSDMTVFAVAALGSRSWSPGTREAMARACYAAGLQRNADQAEDRSQLDRWRAAFESRVQDTSWENVAAGASAFTKSPKALVHWAPVSDEYKSLDREIVENSIRFAWNEVIQDFRSRLDARAVLDDWGAAGRDGSNVPGDA